MKVRVQCAALLLWLCSASVVHAQFWEKKDWKTWSKGDCEKMLNDSPWSRSFENVVVREGATGMRSGSQGYGGESRASLKYSVQLRSALPVRQAVIRLAMIQNKYDKMSADEKKNFDQNAEQYLNQDFSNRVVVHVEYSTNLQEMDRYLAEYWQRSKERDAPLTGDLVTPKGERIRPARFISDVGAAREFELIFPREASGEPYISDADKGFSVELPDIPEDILDNFRNLREGVTVQTRQSRDTEGRGNQQTEKRALIQFDVRKMKYQGKLEY
jgi:hypothetical protein